MNSAIDKVWPQLIERHRLAIFNYCQAAEQLDEQVWQLPVAEEKWSPAQITEHLILTYRITLEQMCGGQGIKPHYNFLLRRVLRLIALPKIIRSGKLPQGARAPAEILPESSAQTRAEALEQLETLSAEFEKRILSARDDKNARLTHHVFGELKLLEAFELGTVHVEHHARQLPGGG